VGPEDEFVPDGCHDIGDSNSYSSCMINGINVFLHSKPALRSCNARSFAGHRTGDISAFVVCKDAVKFQTRGGPQYNRSGGTTGRYYWSTYYEF